MYLFYNFCTTLRDSKDHFVHHQEFMIYSICSSVQTMQTCLTAWSYGWNRTVHLVGLFIKLLTINDSYNVKNLKYYYSVYNVLSLFLLSVWLIQSHHLKTYFMKTLIKFHLASDNSSARRPFFLRCFKRRYACLPHHPWFYPYSNIHRKIKILNVPVMQFSPVSVSSPPLVSERSSGRGPHNIINATLLVRASKFIHENSWILWTVLIIKKQEL